MPFCKSLRNFAAVFNEMFLRESPKVNVKYTLLEVQVIEIANMDTPKEVFSVPFKLNFGRSTSREVDFLKSKAYCSVVNLLCKSLQRRDFRHMVDLQNRGNLACASNLGYGAGGRRTTYTREKPKKEEDAEPKNGLEFFFANICLRMYQLPILFFDSSEFPLASDQGCFMILVFEKVIKKRVVVPTRLDFKEIEMWQEAFIQKHFN